MSKIEFRLLFIFLLLIFAFIIGVVGSFLIFSSPIDFDVRVEKEIQEQLRDYEEKQE